MTSKLTQRLLDKNSNLKELELDRSLKYSIKFGHVDDNEHGTHIDDQNLFLAALERNRTVETVFIYSNFLENLTSDQISMIFKSILAMSRLRFLSLSLRDIGKAEQEFRLEVAKAFSNALGANTTLTELELYAPGMDWNIFAMHALRSNQSLQKLDLCYNGIWPEDCRAIADALCFNSTLKTLGLAYNRIQNAGFGAIKEALRQNSTITNLTLNCTGIIDEDCEQLAQMLQDNNTLKCLNLLSNKVGSQSREKLVNALEDNTSITKIDLTGWILGIQEEKVKRLSHNELLDRYLRLNIAGRHLLKNKSGATHEDLVEALIRARGDIECLFYFLSRKPDICNNILCQ